MESHDGKSRRLNAGLDLPWPRREEQFEDISQKKTGEENGAREEHNWITYGTTIMSKQ